VVRLLFWTHFVSAIRVPFFRDWGGLDLGQILLLNAWFMFWNCVLEVPTGAVADRFGRRASLLLGLAVGALSIPPPRDRRLALRAARAAARAVRTRQARRGHDPRLLSARRREPAHHRRRDRAGRPASTAPGCPTSEAAYASGA
jgi:hypothetical protein